MNERKYFDSAVFAEENVRRFQITVDQTLFKIYNN